MTTISCVITSYNNGKWLRQCVESVLAQSRQPEEIILADDCSTDGSRELIRSLADAHPTIKAVFRDANLGVAANRDLAIRAVSKDLVTTLDGDDFYYPPKIENELRVFTENRGAIVVY